MQVDFRGVLRPTKTRIADDIYPRAQPLVRVHSLADCRRCLLFRADNISRPQEQNKTACLKPASHTMQPIKISSPLKIDTVLKNP